MILYNTLTGKKEEFKPMVAGKVKMYSCGPTVYNYFHIGNARPFIIFDTLRRYFEYRGMTVEFVQNFTDVDDKLINKAREEGTTVSCIAEKYIAEYFADAEGLGIERATVHPRATENIDAIITLVQTLLDKGFAYEVGGDVYFRTKRFGDYGKLSHQPLEELESGARIEVDERKEDPMDFALWKKQKESEIFWDSPWGKGRPGWHIECSAMACRFLGETIDIHSGGRDLIFPHHENEKAQSEAANGKPFANYWLHNGYINVDNIKMSKSLGNFFTVRDIAQKYDYEVIRFFMLSAHYRSPINFSQELLSSARTGLDRIYNCKNRLEEAAHGASPAADEQIKGFKEKFTDAMDDDLNTAGAIGVLFEAVRYANGLMAENAGKDLLAAALKLIKEIAGVLNLLTKEEEKSVDADIELLIEQRQQARKDKNFALADELRGRLDSMGIVLEDTREGVRWSRK